MDVSFIDGEGKFNLFVRKVLFNKSKVMQVAHKLRKPIKLGPHMDRLSLARFLVFREAHIISSQRIPYFEGDQKFFVLQSSEDIVLECFFLDLHSYVKIRNWDIILRLVTTHSLDVVIRSLGQLSFDYEIPPPRRKYDLTCEKMSAFILWLHDRNQTTTEPIDIPISAFCDYIPEDDQDIINCFLTIHRVNLNPRERKFCIKILTAPQFKETCSVFNKTQRNSFPINFYSRKISRKNLKSYHSCYLERIGFTICD